MVPWCPAAGRAGSRRSPFDSNLPRPSPSEGPGRASSSPRSSKSRVKKLEPKARIPPEAGLSRARRSGSRGAGGSIGRAGRPDCSDRSQADVRTQDSRLCYPIALGLAEGFHYLLIAELWSRILAFLRWGDGSSSTHRETTCTKVGLHS